MAQDDKSLLQGSLSNLSLACLSDSDLRAHAERELAGCVKLELLGVLDRANLVKLLLANTSPDEQQQQGIQSTAVAASAPASPTAAVTAPAASPTAAVTAPAALPATAAPVEQTAPLQLVACASTSTGSEPAHGQADRSSGSSTAPGAAHAGRQRSIATSPAATKTNKVALAATSMWCMLAKQDNKESPTKTQQPHNEATEAKEAAEAARMNHQEAADVQEAAQSQSSASGAIAMAAQKTPEKKATARSATQLDLHAYMTREPVEQALARKCNAISSSSIANVPSPPMPADAAAKEHEKQDVALLIPSDPGDRKRCDSQKGEENLAKRVKTSKVGRPRKVTPAAAKDDNERRPQVKLSKVARPRRDTAAAAVKEEEQQQGQPRSKKAGRLRKKAPAQEVEQEDSGEALPSSGSTNKARLVCHVDSANMKNSSICAVLAHLGISNGGSNAGSSKLEVLPGDLLLAASGAHERWELDTSLNSWLKERLRPSSAQLPATWALKPHQEEGVHWLMSRAASRFGCILADDMGLGKTRQAIAWLLGVRLSLEASGKSAPVADTGIDQPASLPELPSGVSLEPSPGQPCEWSPFSSLGACGTRGCGQPACSPVKWERALVLAPSMLVRGEDSVWIKELREVIRLWNVHLRVWQWHGERSGELRSVAYTAQWSGPLIELYDVVIVSYESFLIHHEEFCKESWTCVILDEAQCIKNHGAQIAAATKKLTHTPFRLAMTGSPIENCLEDFHSILEFVQPDCAGTVQDFRQRFPPTEEGRAALRRLSHLLVLRRESSIAVNMVPREEVEVAVQMTDVQRCLSQKLVEQGVSSIKRLKDLELLCTHPWCYAQRSTEDMQKVIPERFLGAAAEQSISDSSKLQELFGILRGLLGTGQKVLVFFCRVITSELVAALVQKEFGIEPGIIRGDTSNVERERMIREFKADPDSGSSHSQVLLLSVWIGALGLNLPEARWVIHIERVWNPALERQATSRVHRITSQLPVKAYCLFTEDSIEERKRAVLLHKRGLSSRIFEVLDGDQEDEDDAVLGNTEVRELISGVSKLTTDSDEENAALEEGEGEDVELVESDKDDSKGDEQEKGVMHPLYDTLKPNKIQNLFRGKYGDPNDPHLWKWYAVEGRREVNPRALQNSTAGLLPATAAKTHVTTVQASQLASRPCRLYDPKARADWQVTLDIKGEPCRLFIPENQRQHFTEDSGKLQLCPPREGSAPFPIFMPSAGRSAVAPEVGLLDLTPTMVGADGKPLDFVQIVAVKPSEVEKYRASAPFFVVMELPASRVVEHPSYGRSKPEELGVGCSRHWLMLLADALEVDHILMLDDSVRLWYGVTLARDAHSLFGLTPGPKAQFTRIGLGHLLQYFTPQHFPAEEFQKFSVIGFARHCPEMYNQENPHRRSHVYSAMLLNVKKVFREQQLNFREDLFVWEDIEFTQRVHDVCKSFRFAMRKKPFKNGGCTSHIARSENPNVRCTGFLERLSPSEIAAEALEETSHGISARGSVHKHMPHRSFKKRQALSKRKVKLAQASMWCTLAKQSNKADAAAAKRLEVAGVAGGPSAAELASRTQFELENDAALQPEGAVCNADGYLLRAYYRRFVQAFKDKERSRADPAAPTGMFRPGMRPEEEVPRGLRHWDDTTSKAKSKGKNGKVWGAGWVADHPYKKGAGTVGKAMWFNIRVWGSWRLAFFLARLQRATWMARCTVPAEEAAASATSDAGAASSAGLDTKTPVKSSKRGPGKQRAGQEKEQSEKKRSRKKDPQSTLFNFFERLPEPEETAKAEPAAQRTILNFFGKQKATTEDTTAPVATSTPESEPSCLSASVDALQLDA